MASLITYDDKVSLRTSPLPNANKCTADDLNEIKTVVNTNATETNTLNAQVQELIIEKLTIDDLFDSYSVTKPTDYAIYKIGNRIQINRCVFSGITVSANAQKTLGYIKSQYRPSTSIRTLGNIGGGGTINAVIFVDTDGKVNMQPSTAGSNTNGYWFSNSWVFEG